MTAQILTFNGVTCLDVPADRVLTGVMARFPKSVVVMGYDENGDEFFASSIADGGTVMWLMERCKHKLMGGE